MRGNTKYMLIAILHSIVPICVLWLYAKAFNIIMYLTNNGGTTFDYSSETAIFAIFLPVLIASVFVLAKVLIKSEIKRSIIFFRLFLNWIVITVIMFTIVTVIDLLISSIGGWGWAVLIYIFGGFITMVLSSIISSALTSFTKKK